MADTVRYFMEGMVPELEDLEERGIFSKQELREVVRKRENFEYGLKRKLPARADFLRYVEYERALAEILQLRKVKLGIREETKGEMSIVKRCHMIYERATRKFRGDLRLWLSWLEYCKDSNSTRQMSKVLTKALQLHSRAAGLWSYAASWEFEHNKHTTVARSLMQQGLRVCKGDQQLWLDYLRMELVYAQKLATRRQILGIAHAPESGRNNDAGAEGLAPDALAAVVNGAIAKVVVKQAVAEFPDSVAFRQRMLETLRDFTFPGVHDIAREIYDSVETDFGGSEEAWDMLARRNTGALASTSDSDALEGAVQVFERAVTELPTHKMFELYSAFLLEQVDGASEAGQGGQVLKGKRKKAAKRVLELYHRAATAGLLSEGAALEWPGLALRCGKIQEALEAARKGSQCHPGSVPLCMQRITLAAQHAAAQVAAGQEHTGEDVASVILEAAKSVAEDEDGGVWLHGLQELRQLGSVPSSLLEGIKAAMAGKKKAPFDGSMGAAAAAAVELLWEQQGAAAARGFYRDLFKLPPPGARLFHAVLDLELAETESPLPDRKMRAVFEAAVDAYGTEDVDVWLSFARFEDRRGKGSGSVYWRATKTLNDPDAFVRQMADSA